MQIAALNTPYLNESRSSCKKFIEHEKEVMQVQQVINEGKPGADC